ncbi:ketoacyl-ACP synthase III [Pelagibacteraceae bacterium]|nr:ketoacyl-ACP synthase III [Pelagibacteraceae bacterium]
MGIKITEIEFAVPDNKSDLNNLESEFYPWKTDEILKKTGVNTRHIADTKETALDLAAKASNLILRNQKKNSIDGIIFCTQSPDYIIPSNSFLLQDKLSLRNDIFNFDFNHACSGYIYSLIFADSFLSRNIVKKMLLINADTYSKYINKKDRSTKALFGDAAAATIVEYDKTSNGIIDYNFYADGSGYKNFWIPKGASKVPITKKDKNSNPEIEMNGLNVWSFINTIVPKQINNILKKNNLFHKDIDHYIFHQSSLLSIESLIKKMDLDNNKVTINLDKFGNTVSASIPIALKEAIQLNKIKSGAKVILSGFGAGLSSAVILMQF